MNPDQIPSPAEMQTEYDLLRVTRMLIEHFMNDRPPNKEQAAAGCAVACLLAEAHHPTHPNPHAQDRALALALPVAYSVGWISSKLTAQDLGLA